MAPRCEQNFNALFQTCYKHRMITFLFTQPFYLLQAAAASFTLIATCYLLIAAMQNPQRRVAPARRTPPSAR
jgi:hypothetical protein